MSASDFRGTNHVWIPALGINKSVRAFPCDRERPPDNFMYRWGCAGENNVYLMGHAYSAMKPLHDAYYNGRLKVGLKVYYAGSNGKVRTYAVRWWKKTLPTPDASWAWAPQDEAIDDPPDVRGQGQQVPADGPPRGGRRLGRLDRARAGDARG